MTQRQLNITVQKKESNWWERLTKQEKRPVFLAPDFDRWLDESDAEMELKEKVSPMGTHGLCCCSALELGLLHLPGVVWCADCYCYFTQTTRRIG